MSRSDDLSAPPATADTLEHLLGRAVGAPPVTPELEAGAMIARRYTVERVLGAGGMGTVYLARDSKLDRLVAIKLHRTVADAERLHGEAVAMARLAHPNVVTVHEVGELDGHPFVVMEYVAGETLRTWLTRASRSRRDILAELRAVGDGLDAAHAAGLVHRDVKPDNVLIGEDGRARIGDFGLARVDVNEPGPDTGRVAGTPAYMAPEQSIGGAVDARSDQFAFAVMTWEALAGVHPFEGSTRTEIRDAIARGEPRGRVPGRMRRVLMRAMAVDPAARFPSLRAFLDALVAAERLPRRLALGGLVTAIAGASITMAAWPAADPNAACESIASELDRVLPAHETARLVAAMEHSGAPHAAERARVLERTFAAHRADHAQQARTACRARVQKQWSPELVAASRECLTFHARTANEQVHSIPVTAATVVDAMQVSVRLPEITSCTDPRILAGWQRIESDAAIAARAKLVVAEIHVELGQFTSARALMASVPRDSPAIALRHDLVMGLQHLGVNELPAAEKLLEATYLAARARDDGEVGLGAVNGLVRASAMLRRDTESAKRWIDNALADAERERTRHPDLAATVRLTAAVATIKGGDVELGARRLREVEALINEHRSLLRIALLAAKADLYSEVAQWDDAIAAFDAELALVRDGFGAHHPIVAQVQAERASVLLEAGRQDAAVVALRDAIQIAEDDREADGPGLAATETSIGATLIAAGDPRARAFLERARARLVRAYGNDHPDVALVDSNLALIDLDAGETARALVALRHAVAVQEAQIGADHVELAVSLYNLAVVERETGALDVARTTAKRCADIYGRRQPRSPRHVYALVHIALIENLARRHADAVTAAETALAAVADDEEQMGPAWARLELAKALIALRRDPARARTALTESRAMYGVANMPERVAEIDGLLAALR